MGSIPGQGTYKILHAVLCDQKKKKNQTITLLLLHYPFLKKTLLMNLEGELSTEPLVIKKEYFFIVYKQEQDKAYQALICSQMSSL